MSKINKKGLAARIASAGSEDHERFTRAAQVLAVQPTGFGESKPTVEAHIPRATAAAEYFAEIPVDEIEFNPFNARRIYSEERVKNMAVSLAASGQEVPGSATRRGAKYILAAGHYRLRGLRLAGLPTMKLMVREGMSDQDLYRVSFIENDERSGQSGLDNALAWRDMLDRGLYGSESEIAAATGKSLPTINKTLAILDLAQPILDLVMTDPEAFGMSILFELRQLEKAAGETIALETAALVLTGDASRRSIQELREGYEHPKERKKKENSRQNYRIYVNEAAVGSIKEWNDGRVSLDIRVEEPTARAAVMAELKRLFKIDPGS